MGKGSFPDNHELSRGISGWVGTAPANQTMREADVLLAVGTRFTETDTSGWTDGSVFSIPPTRVIQIDIDPAEIARYYPIEVGIVGDVGGYFPVSFGVCHVRVFLSSTNLANEVVHLKCVAKFGAILAAHRGKVADSVSKRRHASRLSATSGEPNLRHSSAKGSNVPSRRCEAIASALRRHRLEHHLRGRPRPMYFGNNPSHPGAWHSTPATLCHLHKTQ